MRVKIKAFVMFRSQYPGGHCRLLRQGKKLLYKAVLSWNWGGVGGRGFVRQAIQIHRAKSLLFPDIRVLKLCAMFRDELLEVINFLPPSRTLIAQLKFVHQGRREGCLLCNTID